jgi:hypothetical protein
LLMSSARLCASDPLQAEKQHVRSRGAAQPTDVTTDFVLLRLTPRASAQSNLLTESMNAACYNECSLLNADLLTESMNAACYYGTAGCAACLSPPSAILWYRRMCSMSKSTFCYLNSISQNTSPSMSKSTFCYLNTSPSSRSKSPLRLQVHTASSEAAVHRHEQILAVRHRDPQGHP